MVHLAQLIFVMSGNPVDRGRHNGNDFEMKKFS